MSTRVKLTLWYVGVLFVSQVVCGALLYHEWVVVPRMTEKHHEAEDDDMLEDLVESVFWSSLPAAVLGFAGGWWLMRKAMSPVAALTKTVEQLNESNLNVQLPLRGSGDEFDRLTVVFNGMTVRLGDSFRRMREFTLRASHELKTPLTIMRSSMETALNEQQMSPEQKERLHGELDEVDRLATIVDGLTLLTKADAGLITLKQEHVRLDLLLREIFNDGQVLARPVNVNVRLDVCDEATIAGDSNRLRQMLLNLVDNAVKYNQPGGSVTLALRNSGRWAEIAIANTGPGVPVALLPRLFDPFFRVDASHTREIDGCGLGLAIVQWIATAHGGTVIMTSHAGELTTAKVLLPLSVDFIKALRP